MVTWTGAVRRWLAVSAHPTRLPVTLVDTASVFASSFLVAAISARAGIGGSMLSTVLGGLLCFNVMLFLPAGGIAAGWKRFAMLLAVNLVPAVVAALHGYSTDAADLVLVIAAGGAVLARRFGTLAGTLGLLTAINVMIALILGAAPRLAADAAIAAPVATLVAVAGDALGRRLASRYGMGSARGTVAAELAGFLDALKVSWVHPDAPWPTDRLSSRIVELRTTIADLVALPVSAGGLPQYTTMMVSHHLLGSLVRSLGKLHDRRNAIPTQFCQQITDVLGALAQAARAGDLALAGDAVTAFRTAAVDAPLEDETGQPVALLGTALLLADLVESAAEPPPPPPPASAPPGFHALIGAIEGRLAVQAMVAVALALLAARLLPLSRPYWVPLTALILTTSSFGENLRKSSERIGGTALGLLLGQVIWVLAGDVTVLIDLVIVVSVFGIFFGRGGAYGVILFWLSTLISIVLHVAGGPGSVYIGRFVDTLIGAAITVLVTLVVMPVRTGRAVRSRIAGLLTAIAARIADIANRLRESGIHRRTGAAEQVAVATQDLHALARAEWLEAGVLRTPRLLIARRIEAADRSVQYLMYLDELLPTLPGCHPDTRAILDALVDTAQCAATAIGARGTLPQGVPMARFHEADDAVQAAYRDGGMSIGQLHAERRMLHILARLSDAITTLADTSASTGFAGTVRDQGSSL